MNSVNVLGLKGFTEVDTVHRQIDRQTHDRGNEESSGSQGRVGGFSSFLFRGKGRGPCPVAVEYRLCLKEGSA